jgi:hypothetical protein
MLDDVRTTVVKFGSKKRLKSQTRRDTYSLREEKRVEADAQ